MTDTKPKQPSPVGTCDTHMHIFEPGYTQLPGTNLPAIPGNTAEYRVHDAAGKAARRKSSPWKDETP